MIRYWQICHGLCIVAHFGMAVAGLVAFIIAGQQNVSSRIGSSNSFSNFGRSQRSSIERVILPWATFGVAALSLSSNVIALIAISVFEFKRTASRTQRRLSLLKGFIILTFVGNFVLGIADAVLVGFLASRVSLYSVLTAPLALAAVSAVFAFVTGFCYIAHYRSCSKFQPQESNQQWTAGWGQPQYPNQFTPQPQQQYGYQPPHGNQSSWTNQPSYGNQPGYDYQHAK